MKTMKYFFSFTIILVLLSIWTISFSGIRKIASNIWKGTASYYNPKFNGRKTATGEIFNNDKLTAANNFLSLGTRVKITNSCNGKSVIVKINDRMHAANKRLIDLSQAAAQQIGLINQGIGEVTLELITTE